MGVFILALKLLITASTFPRFTDDTEPRFIYDLSSELLKHDIEVTVLAPAAPNVELIENMGGVRVIRYRYAPARSWETLAYPGAIIPRIKENPIRLLLVPLLIIGLYRAVNRLLHSEHFNCVHAHWIIPQGIIQSLISGKDNPPYVITGHGADVVSLNWPIVKSFKKNSLKKAKALTAVSKPLSNKMRELLEDNKAQIKVIPMGCDLSRFSPSFRQEDYYYQFGLSGPIILFVGRLAEKKGVNYLLHSFKKIGMGSLAIVGDGPEKARLMNLCHELELDKRVVFLGALSHKELPQIYASADIFCAPSIIASDGDVDGVPTVLLEAEASGLPIVGTKVGGIPEVIVHNENGFLVEEKDENELSQCLKVLVEDKSIRMKMAEKSRIIAEKFSWSVVGEAYARVITDIVQAREINTSEE